MPLKRLFLFFILFVLPLQTFAQEGIGQFVTVHSKFQIKGNSAVKLSDGRLLFGIKTIFDPKTNTFYKTKYYDDDAKIDAQIALNDGRVMFFSPKYDSLPTNRLKYSNEFKKQIEAVKSYTFMNQYEKEQAKRKFWEDYYNLTEDERAKIYMPIIEENPEFRAIYNRAIKEYDNSKYIKIYDPKADKLKLSAKSNSKLGKVETLVLKDGKVLMVYGFRPKFQHSGAYECIESEIEIFNPADETIIKISNPSGFKISRPHLLTDGRVLFQDALNEIVIYNPKDNSFFKSKHKINGDMYNLEDGRVFSSFGNGIENIFYIAVYDPENDTLQKIPLGFNRFYRLNSGKILIFHLDNKRNMLVSIFDPKINKIIPAGRLKTYRHAGEDVLLKNDNILMYDGINYKRSGYFVGTIDENRLELLNPYKGKSIIINEDIKKGRRIEGKPVVLDDGRVFLGYDEYSNNAIIYTPDNNF